MALFGRKKRDEEDDDDYEVEERSIRRIKDLKPENKKKRKEPAKPWGKKERYLVLITFLVTIFTASVLAISARDFKLPGIPKFKFPEFFKEETIVIGSKKNYSQIITDFEAKTRRLSGTYALYVIDLTTGESFGVREEKVMQAASLIKLPVMLYVQGKVDDSKLEAMGKRSDNNVFNEMVKKFGEEELQNYIQSIGMVNTSISENETTPKEIGEFFKNFKEEFFMAYLSDTIYEEWLTPGVPEDVIVVHKYGREVHVVNDAGIVYSTRPYIVVIMTQGIVEKEADLIFPELSKLVYDGMTQ